MEALNRDDLIHAINQTLGFYGKSLDKPAVAFWMNALSGHDVHSIKLALMEYTKVGKYAPKPVDILDLLQQGAEERRARLAPPKCPETNCPEPIARAWQWYIGRNASGSVGDGLFENQGDLSLEEQEACLLVVNQEAVNFDHPEAILPEHRLPHVWATYQPSRGQA